MGGGRALPAGPRSDHHVPGRRGDASAGIRIPQRPHRQVQVFGAGAGGCGFGNGCSLSGGRGSSAWRRAGRPGNWVVGTSTKPNTIPLLRYPLKLWCGRYEFCPSRQFRLRYIACFLRSPDLKAATAAVDAEAQ